VGSFDGIEEVMADTLKDGTHVSTLLEEITTALERRESPPQPPQVEASHPEETNNNDSFVLPSFLENDDELSLDSPMHDLRYNVFFK